MQLKRGAQPDSRDMYGRMPLSSAAATGHVDIVKLLLGNGVKLDSRDMNDRTPLSFAAATSHAVEYGANPDSTDTSGRIPRSRAEAEPRSSGKIMAIFRTQKT
jgi:hypothetical protein